MKMHQKDKFLYEWCNYLFDKCDKKGIEENKNRFLFDGAQHNY
jgi:hypothetical protein